MHNQHSAEMLNHIQKMCGQRPTHVISKEELFPKQSNCGVQFNPQIYRDLELRTSENDPQWHPTKGWTNKTIFWQIFHTMHDLAHFKENLARAAEVKVDLVDQIIIDRYINNPNLPEPTSTQVPESSSKEPPVPDVITEEQRSQIEEQENNSLFMEKNLVDVCLRRQFVYNLQHV